ncbi:hypothetical protein V1J52_19885 [Streptomyces sp. TRM 70351]|uniref:hypothetical protein n=1 Tax=Streptomyces sp. TRM 70351 TaxID=3116552 RepID=UPI002E7BFCA3|nr:hypothetical protein [Streptomyces sp. TRM 70351]MEE1930416.1 hypothetical protein [Streptomyces sp. TRM 70351]
MSHPQDGNGPRPPQPPASPQSVPQRPVPQQPAPQRSVPGEGPGPQPQAGPPARRQGGGGRRRKQAARSVHGPGGVAERTGDPVIPPGARAALATAVLAGLLALAAPAGRWALVVPLLLLQALTAAGWYRLNGMWPARQGIALAFLAGVTADAALLLADREHAETALLGTLGFWVLLVLVLQLRSRSTPDERLYALTAGVAATVLTVFAAGYLAAVDVSAGLVTVGAAAVAGAVLVRRVPLPGPLSVAAALLAGTGAAWATSAAVGPDDAVAAALTGAAAALCALAGLRAASYDWPSRFVHLTAGVALPLTLAAPAVHVLARLTT